MKKNNGAFFVAFCAVMFACIFVAMMLDRAISATLPISMAACTLLIVFSFCFVQNDWRIGALSGVFFGLASLLKEMFFPSLITTQLLSLGKWYILPVQYLIPRVVVGVAAFAVYKLMLLLCNKMQNGYLRQTVALTVATVVGLLVNTLLFLSVLAFSNVQAGVDTTLIAILSSVVVINILPEYLISILLTPHVVLGVRKAMRWGINAERNEEEEK